MALNAKDLRILQELDNDPQIRLSALAKRVGLSQQVVDYRVKQLLAHGTINHFGTIINPAILGFEQYRILFQISFLTNEEKRAILSHLQKHSQVYWAALVGNKWDILVAIYAKSYQELDHFLHDIFSRFPKSFQDFDVVKTLSHEFYGHKYLHSKPPYTQIKLSLDRTNQPLEIDEIDYSILQQIRMNCRRPSLEVSKHCGVTYKTVQQRIKKLEHAGIIAGYRLFLRSELHGYRAYLLFLSFRSYGRVVENKLMGYARNNKCVTQASKLFGRWSLLFHIRAPDELALQELLVELRNMYPSIGDYEIVPVFEDIAIDHFPFAKGA